jgi:predicted TIM-barrel fold metal-dependent hydrolase
VITDAELETLHRGGIRAIRFFLHANAAATLAMARPLADRVKELGWHVDFGASPDQIVAVEDLLMSFPATIVFDQMAHIPGPIGSGQPAFTIIRKLLDKGRTWVKLSMTYRDSKDGPPTYADVTKVAQAFVQAAPERMIWGTNWPHPNEASKLDDAMIFDLLSQWAPDEATRHRILVENPEVLYGFSKSS